MAGARARGVVAATATAMAMVALLATGAMGIPKGFQDEQVANGFHEPVGFMFLPEGCMVSIEAKGVLTIINPDTKKRNEYMYLNNIEDNGEKGLLSIVADPDFEYNGHFYLYYSRYGAFRVARFQHQTNNGDVSQRGNPNSEQILWTDKNGMKGPYHYGGQLSIGPEGCLWWVMGDKYDGASDNPSTNAGGVFRLNRDGSTPQSNFGRTNGYYDDALFAYGVRNGWRSNWDIPTGRFFIAEVGGNDQNKAWEDLHLLTLDGGGTNYGWPNCEGYCDNNQFQKCDCNKHDNPIWSYGHYGRNSCIIGGFVYRGANFPKEYIGKYFFAEYVHGKIEYLGFSNGYDKVNGPTLFHNQNNVINIQMSPEGLVYYSDTSGNVRRIRYTSGPRGVVNHVGPQTPAPMTTTTTTTLPPNNAPELKKLKIDVVGNKNSLTRRYSCSASDKEGEPLSYEWNFGDDSFGTESESVEHTYDNPGKFTVWVSVSDGTNTVTSDFFTVIVGPTPTVRITSPVINSKFEAGDVIDFEATGSSPDGKKLRFSWVVLLKHDNHMHGGDEFDGAKGSMKVADSGHPWSGKTALVATVTAETTFGTTATATVTIVPRKVNYYYRSQPTGEILTLDSIPMETPFRVDDLVGFKRTLEIDEQADGCVAGYQRAFLGWLGSQEAPYPEDATLVTAGETDITIGSASRTIVAVFDKKVCQDCGRSVDCPDDYFCNKQKACGHCRECFTPEGGNKNGQCPKRCDPFRPAGQGQGSMVDIMFGGTDNDRCVKHQACDEGLYCTKFGACFACGECYKKKDGFNGKCPKKCTGYENFFNEMPAGGSVEDTTTQAPVTPPEAVSPSGQIITLGTTTTTTTTTTSTSSTSSTAFTTTTTTTTTTSTTSTTSTTTTTTSTATAVAPATTAAAPATQPPTEAGPPTTVEGAYMKRDKKSSGYQTYIGVYKAASVISVTANTNLESCIAECLQTTECLGLFSKSGSFLGSSCYLLRSGVSRYQLAWAVGVSYIKVVPNEGSDTRLGKNRRRRRRNKKN